MKFIKFTLITTLLISSLGSFAQLSSGVVAHWNFDGSVSDVSGNAHNGTVHNATPATGRHGIANTAYYFNGTNSYIGAPYRSDLNLSSFTICAIVKPDGYYTGTCQHNMIATRGIDGTTGSYSLYYSDNPYNDCFNYDTALNVFKGKSGYTPTGNATDWQYSPNIRTGNWYNVVITQDGSAYRIYVDGTLKSTTPVTGTLGSSTDSIWIGGNYGNLSYPYWLKGYIDDMRIYNRVLSLTDIATYNSYINIPAFNTNLCAGIPFNLSYYTDRAFTSGNTFSVQLSDATGSFTSPTVVGSVTATTSGSITCTIPAATPAGAGYKLRIVSTLPAQTTEEIAVAVNGSASPTVSLAASPAVIVGKTAAVGMGSSVTFTATTTNATSYTWKKNRVPIAGAPNSNTYVAIANIQFTNNDTISVVARGNSACASPDSATDYVAMLINVGIDDAAKEMNVNAYPNPSNGSFSIKGYLPVNGTLQISVYNTIGQLVLTKEATVKANEVNETIQLGTVSAGIYQVKISDETSSKTMRVTVQ